MSGQPWEGYRREIEKSLVHAGDVYHRLRGQLDGLHADLQLLDDILSTFKLERNWPLVPEQLRVVVDSWLRRAQQSTNSWPIGPKAPRAFCLSPEDVQLITLGLAVLSIESPGFQWACRGAAERMAAHIAFDELVSLRKKREQ